jgi:hypothetical protein
MSVTVGITTWIGYTPLYIALEKGFFKELGLDLKLQVFETISPDAAAAAFQKEDLEVVYTYSPFSDRALKAQKDGRILFG